MTVAWDDMSSWMQNMVLAYDQIRQYEEARELQLLASVPKL